MPPSSFSGAKILITGGAGFIGSHLARRLLSEGAQVSLADSFIPQYGGNPFNLHDIRDKVHLNVTDVRDPHGMAYLVRGQDFLFNLAGQTSHLDSMNDPKTDLDINAAASLSILEACRKNNPGIKLVFASTRQIYGKPEYLPVNEDHPIRPVDVNGINKVAGEWYHLLYNNVYGLKACALRLTNTYGPAMRVKDARQTFLGIWIRRMVEGEPFDVFGDGAQVRDFNYVDDAVEAMALAALSAKSEGRVFNLGGEERVSLKALADVLVEANGGGSYKIVPFPPDRKIIDIGDYYGDFGKIQAALGWAPRVKLREGLKKTLDYFSRHRAEYW